MRRQRNFGCPTHLLSIQLDGAIRVVEPLLHYGGKFADALAFVSQHVLSTRRQDDDLGTGWRHTDLEWALMMIIIKVILDSFKLQL